MDGMSKTSIKNPETGEIKDFNFDYSYWSHNDFIEETYKGEYLRAKPGSRYSDQNKVFLDLGVEVLDNAF